MDKIKVNSETYIFLNFETQISKLGRNFRLSGVSKISTIPQKYINNSYKNHWVYTFRYLDVDREFFEIEIDYNNSFVRLNKIKNE
jgi:hypothetical protein